MTQESPPGAQDPDAPHPGTITFVYLWNNSREVESAGKVPDRIKFFCVDKQNNEVERTKATWCIPVVEIETFSVDEHGKPTVPKDADYIHIRAYGPNHTFLKSTVTPPSREPPPELLNKPQLSVPAEGVTLRRPQPFSSQPQSATFSDGLVSLRQEGQLGWWRRVKVWLGIA